MPVCGYVVVPRPGEAEDVSRALAGLPGCEIAPAENAELLLLVTCAESLADDAALRRRVQKTPGIEALLLTFGEVDADAAETDPIRRVP